MGNGGGTTSHSTSLPDRRGRRRPHPNSSETHHTSHRRFQVTHAASLQSSKPNYPTNPFGNVGDGALQLPAPVGRKRSSLEEAVTNSRNEERPQQLAYNTGVGRSGTVWGDESRTIREVVSVKGGNKEDLYGSRGDLLRIDEGCAKGDGHDSLYSHRGHNRSGQLLHGSESPHLSMGRSKAEDDQVISSGPSAIDLFDQCGLVPMAAIEREGLVGTTDRFPSTRKSPKKCDNTDGMDVLPSMVDHAVERHSMAPALHGVSRPPLVPGGEPSMVCDFRAARGHPRDERRHEARAPRTKRNQPSATHGVKPRPPFAGGSISNLSRRTKHAQQKASSSSGADAVVGVPKSGRNLGRGVPSDGATPESFSRCTREEGPSNEDLSSTPQTDSRARRRWKIDGANSTARVAPSRSDSPSASAPTSAPLSSSEQRIASAKERLHKDKDLNALKSEHVEALSILQDISCPSTATGTVAARHEPNAEEKDSHEATAAAEIALLQERKNSSAAATAGASVVAAAESEVEQLGLPADAGLSELSADLPRIGSREEAALRAMYRKWWMKVANGGSPPSPCTPIAPSKGLSEGVPPLFAEQELVAESKRAAEDSTTSADASTSRNGQSSEVGDAEARLDCGRLVPHNPSAKATAVESHVVLGEAEVAAALRESGELGGTSATGEVGGHGEEGSIVDVSAAGTGGKVEEAPAERENRTGGVTLCTKAGMPPPPGEERAGRGPAASCGGMVASDQPQEELGQQQQRQQPIVSDVESVSEDDGLEKEQEEGHHGRIYLPDGRFVSTWRNSAGEETADAVKTLKNLEQVGGDDACSEVLDKPEANELDDESFGYAEDFED